MSRQHIRKLLTAEYRHCIDNIGIPSTQMVLCKCNPNLSFIHVFDCWMARPYSLSLLPLEYKNTGFLSVSMYGAQSLDPSDELKYVSSGDDRFHLKQRLSFEKRVKHKWFGI